MRTQRENRSVFQVLYERKTEDSSFTQLVSLLLLMGTLLITFSEPVASHPSPTSTDESARIFDYDRSSAFDLKEESAKKQDSVTIRDVNYAAYTSQRGRVKAYLVQPGGQRSFPGRDLFPLVWHPER